MLIVFSGLPGSGKKAMARALASRRDATYLRIDTIERAIRAGEIVEVGPAGYMGAYAVAVDNLVLGRTIIADCVNPVSQSREAWRQAAIGGGSAIIEIESFAPIKTNIDGGSRLERTISKVWSRRHGKAFVNMNTNRGRTRVSSSTPGI